MKNKENHWELRPIETLEWLEASYPKEFHDNEKTEVGSDLMILIMIGFAGFVLNEMEHQKNEKT